MQKGYHCSMKVSCWMLPVARVAGPFVKGPAVATDQCRYPPKTILPYYWTKRPFKAIASRDSAKPFICHETGRIWHIEGSERLCLYCYWMVWRRWMKCGCTTCCNGYVWIMTGLYLLPLRTKPGCANTWNCCNSPANWFVFSQPHADHSSKLISGLWFLQWFTCNLISETDRFTKLTAEQSYVSLACCCRCFYNAMHIAMNMNVHTCVHSWSRFNGPAVTFRSIPCQRRTWVLSGPIGRITSVCPGDC